MTKRSIIWKISDEDFTKLIANSTTTSQVLAYFGLKNKGGNFKTCRARIKSLNLSVDHFISPNESRRIKKQITEETFLKRLCLNSTCDPGSLKTFLIRFNLLEYKCRKCGNKGEWCGENITLQLEHKNGVPNDNRIENLEFLCPNCHSQTNTFAGRNTRKIYLCQICHTEMINRPTNPLKICKTCTNFKLRSHVRPTKESLKQLLSEESIRSISKHFNVSDTTIRNWCIDYDIDYKALSKFSHSPLKSEPLENLKKTHMKEIKSNIEGIECPHCEVWNTHEQCGTYEFLTSSCFKCVECTETIFENDESSPS